MLERLFLMCQMAGHYVFHPLDREPFVRCFILDFAPNSIFSSEHVDVSIFNGHLIVERGEAMTAGDTVVRAQNLLAPMMCALHTSP
jgi:hypothetical protein